MNWLPISSAPKTREILLHYPGIGAVRGTWNSDEHNKYPKPYWVCDRLISWGIRKTRQFQPTHWMELPQAPESEGWASMMRLPADIYREAKRQNLPASGSPNTSPAGRSTSKTLFEPSARPSRSGSGEEASPSRSSKPNRLRAVFSCPK